MMKKTSLMLVNGLRQAMCARTVINKPPPTSTVQPKTSVKQACCPLPVPEKQDCCPFPITAKQTCGIMNTRPQSTIRHVSGFAYPTAATHACRPPSVAINGFGRIGKCLLRLAIQNGLNVVAVNQPFTDTKSIAHSLRLDTVHGPFPGLVVEKDNFICVNGKCINLSYEEKPENIKWKDLQADYVIDATGLFTKMELAKKHLSAGAKKVIVSAPSTDIPMFVKGVNFDRYDKSMSVVSNASCTTNCAAPLIRIVHDRFCVVNCLLTTTHATTASQHVLDGTYHRSAANNIVPASTGAAKAVGIVIPELKGKVDGDSARVPLLDVSLLKLYMNVKDNVSSHMIKCEIKTQAECSAKGLISFYEDIKLVSSDFIGDSHSAIVDFNQIQVIGKFVTIGAWYDNEMGYSNRVLDLLKHMMEVDNS